MANKFADMPDEKLLRFEKTISAIVIMFSIGMLLLLVAVVYTSFKNGFSAMSVIPLGLAPIGLLNFNNLKEIKKEIKVRGLK
ncbi:redox-active disulfide protein 2 [Flavobacterium psychrotrophum]|uniref:redox-active disulfide protein 2 n=1 Tax=Flavobacterium psychrotrophum TaxID=2294119 RepID=UPI000E31C85D|nr:redox-active disulfide protein 2 [Flavobacterium psychrotrophum]